MRLRTLPFGSYTKQAPREIFLNQRQRLFIAAIVVAILPLLMFWRLFILNPQSRAYIREGDLSSQYYPLRAYAASELSAGKIPLWNPYLLAGTPGLADIQMATFYPPASLWAFVCGGDLSYSGLQTQTVLHLSFLAVGMLFLLYNLTGSIVGGVCAAVIFSLGGYATSFPIQQATIIATVAWLPWLLLATGKITVNSGKKHKAIAGFAVIYACALLGGHPQTALYVTYAILAYSLWHCHSWQKLMEIGLGFIFGFGLAACQLLPTIEMIRLSTRSLLPFNEISSGFLLHEITALIFPGYFGGSPQFCGIIALFLAALAITRLPWTKVNFWVSMALFGLIASFGNGTALFSWLYLFAPGFSTSRNQERTILYFAFAVAVLAGYGTAWLAREKTPAHLTKISATVRIAFIVSIALSLILFAGTFLPPASGTDVNLFGGILKQNLWLTAGLGLTRALLALANRRVLQPESTVWALLIFSALNLACVNWQYHLGSAPAAEQHVSHELAAFLTSQMSSGQHLAGGGLWAEGPSAGLLYRIADTTGNTPLTLAAYSQFQKQLPEWRQWQLLAVSHLLAPGDKPDAAGITKVRPGEPAVYALTQPTQPIRFVHELQIVASDEAWAKLAATEFDPARQAIVATQISAAPPAGPETAAILKWEAATIQAHISASSNGLAVFSQVAYPGWKIYVDGKMQSWLLADNLFIAVPLSAGEHNLSLVYQPMSFYLGLCFTVASAIAVIYLACYPAWRHAH